MSTALAAINKDGDISMLMLCAHWHTYSICEDSDYSFTLLFDSWDGGRDMNSSG